MPPVLCECLSEDVILNITTNQISSCVFDITNQAGTYSQATLSYDVLCDGYISFTSNSNSYFTGEIQKNGLQQDTWSTGESSAISFPVSVNDTIIVYYFSSETTYAGNEITAQLSFFNTTPTPTPSPSPTPSLFVSPTPTPTPSATPFRCLSYDVNSDYTTLAYMSPEDGVTFTNYNGGTPYGGMSALITNNCNNKLVRVIATRDNPNFQLYITRYINFNQTTDEVEDQYTYDQTFLLNAGDQISIETAAFNNTFVPLNSFYGSVEIFGDGSTPTPTGTQASPTPTPSPSPTPSHSPSPSPSSTAATPTPTPSPSPSPSASPTPTPSGTESTPTPTPSPSATFLNCLTVDYANYVSYGGLGNGKVGFNFNATIPPTGIIQAIGFLVSCDYHLFKIHVTAGDYGCVVSTFGIGSNAYDHSWNIDAGETFEIILPIGYLQSIVVSGYNVQEDLFSGFIELVNSSAVLPTPTATGPTPTPDATNPTPTPTATGSQSHRLYVGGFNSEGQLGIGNTDAIQLDTPQVIDNNTWQKFTVNRIRSSFAIKSDNYLFSWGDNINGQLGLGNKSDKYSPNQILGGGEWIDVSVSAFIAGGIKSDGTLWIWQNYYTGTTPYISSPIQIFSDTSNWTQISCGTDFAAAIKTDKTLWLWGKNSDGQLGTSDTIDSMSPVQTVCATTDWAQVRCGAADIAAIKTDGSLWLWGYNEDARLGDGTSQSRSSPVQVYGGGTWSSVEKSFSRTQAIKTDGTLWSWGYNFLTNPYQLGLLGINSLEEIVISSPVQEFTGRNNWVKTAAGDNFSFAINTDGEIYYWGDTPHIPATIIPMKLLTPENIFWRNVSIGPDYALFLGDPLGPSPSPTPTQPTPSPTPSPSPTPTPSGTEPTPSPTPSSSPTPTPSGTEATPTPTLSPTPSPSVTLSPTPTTSASPTPTPSGTEASPTPTLSPTSTPTPSPSVSSSPTPSASATPTPTPSGTEATPTPTASASASPTPTTSASPTPTPTGTQPTPTPTASASPTATVTLSPSPTLSPTPTPSPSITQPTPTPSGTQPTPTPTATAIYSAGTLWSWGKNNFGQLGDNDTVHRSSPLQIGLASDWSYVGAGLESGYAVKSDGSLYSWGFGNYGQLGNSSLQSISNPVQVGNQTGWGMLSNSKYYFATIKNDNSLWIWGDILSGDGTTTQYSSPVQIGTTGEWKSVSPQGLGFVHAVKKNGTLWVWGGNAYGIFGNSTAVGSVSSPIQIGTDSTWNKVGAGTNHVLASKDDGTLWAWGRGINGELGNNQAVSASSPVQVLGSNYEYGTGGHNFSLAIRKDGSIWAWGGNYVGELAQNDTFDRSSPVQISAGQTFLKISAGPIIAAAIRNDNTLWMWGYNFDGQLGNQTVTHRSSPTQVGGSAAYFDVSVNTGVLAIGALGNQPTPSPTTSASPTPTPTGTQSTPTPTTSASPTPTPTGTQPTPTPTASPTPTSSVSPTPTPTGTQPTPTPTGTSTPTPTASPTPTTSASPTPTASPAPTSSVSPTPTVTSSPTPTPSGTQPTPTPTTTHSPTPTPSPTPTLGLLCDGYNLWLCGANNYGQLGDGTTVDKSVPVQVTGGNWCFCSIGYTHTAGLKNNRTLWLWGDNTAGQLGDNTAIHRSNPTQINPDPQRWSTISCGNQFNLALDIDGLLYVWGKNDLCQLGIRSTANASSPIQNVYSPPVNWSKVSAGYKHSVGIDKNGYLYCWGNDSFGELGQNNSSIIISSPVQTISNSSDWQDVVAGQYFTLALKNNGSIWGWGKNSDGQLGNNNTNNYSSPIQVGNGELLWTKIVIGSNFSIGLSNKVPSASLTPTPTPTPT